MEKSADAFRTISEVAADLALPQHVLRFWETRFPQIRPLKRAGGRRYYRPADVGLLRSIRHLLYDKGYTIKGVQRLLKEEGARGLPPPDAAAGNTGRILAFDAGARGPELSRAETTDDAASSHAARMDEEERSTNHPTDRPALDLLALRETLACIEDCERLLLAVLAER